MGRFRAYFSVMGFVDWILIFALMRLLPALNLKKMCVVLDCWQVPFPLHRDAAIGLVRGSVIGRVYEL